MPWSSKRHEPQRCRPEPRQRTAGRGYGAAWQRASRRFRREHPLCAECDRRNRVTLGTCVDHIIPHKGDMRLFWNEDNWQTMCDSCHSTKTATEDGGFGHPVAPAANTAGGRLS